MVEAGSLSRRRRQQEGRERDSASRADRRLSMH